jgi:ABC-2 type transport system ATP-binding protein
VQEILRAHQLVKRYKRTIAVDHVDLVITAGERVALLGPNGAGKTTTLFMLLGVVAPDEGWVRIGDRVLPRERSRAMQDVGFSAGYMPLSERLRVKEFLYLYGQLQGIPNPTEQITMGLERFGISRLADVMSSELSSGQRTLVGIVKAIMHRPRLLVLDEPTASLDPDIALRVRTGLHELWRDEGTTLLVTSHNMVEIERLCDRIVFLSRGRVVADDSPAAVADHFGSEDLESVFLHLAGGGEAVSTAQETDRP